MDNSNHHRISYSSGDSSASSLTSTADPSSTTTATSRDQFLRHLNKLSHKISKPTISSAPFIRRPPPDPPLHHRPPPPMPPLQQQPPVYNISKSDFRDVVQKLTGSPAHDRPQAPAPPIQAPKPASSRLQRIRPPPLAQLTNRPPPLLNVAGGGFMRPPPPGAPLSPLPPLPSCHAAAESPISAYMRFLHSSASDQKFGNPMLPPPAPPQMQPNPMNPLSESLLPPPPSSPLPAFGCLLSPKSPCPLLFPNLLFSPTAGAGLLGFPQLPVSPTVPGGVPSPK